MKDTSRTFNRLPLRVPFPNNGTKVLKNPELSNYRSLILAHFSHFCGTRREFYHATGIIPSSITQIVNDLKDEGLLWSVGKTSDIHTGRTAEMLTANRKVYEAYLAGNFSYLMQRKEAQR